MRDGGVRERVGASLRRGGGWSVWLIVAVGLLVYANSLDGPFVYDDALILKDRDIRQLLPPWQAVFASPNSATAGRPVVHYTLALNHAVGGLDVRGYRAVNLAVHLACTLMLFAVVRRTLMLVGGRLGEASRGVAAAVALIWMVHPLQSECVNYISQRSESMMGLFFLLTLYASIRALDSERRGVWFAVAIAGCALGMATKEAMVTAPVIVVFYDAVFAGRTPRDLLRERWGLYAGLAACWILLAGLMATGPRTSTVGFSLGTSAFDYAKNQCIVILEYLRLVFWPHPLVVDYGYPRTLSVTEVAPYAVALALLVAGSVVLLVRWPKIGFAAAWMFIILAPTSSFVPIVTEVGAERRMYLPLAGPIVLIVAGAYLLIRRLGRDEKARRTGIALVLVTAALLAWATVLRNRDYRSAVSIWRTAVQTRSDNHRAHGNLGKALQKEGKLDEAMAHYRRALELRPDYVEGLNNLGGALQASGRPDEAIEYFRRAIEIGPGYVSAHYNLATALQSRRQLDEAVVHYRLALRLQPDYASAHNNLGTALGSQGKLEEAILHFREALRLEPEYTEARKNLELALERVDSVETEP
jgi:tetratricopeptide (TPR) repeat protein